MSFSTYICLIKLINLKNNNMKVVIELTGMYYKVIIVKSRFLRSPVVVHEFYERFMFRENAVHFINSPSYRNQLDQVHINASDVKF